MDVGNVGTQNHNQGQHEKESACGRTRRASLASALSLPGAFSVPRNVAWGLGRMAIVQHGVDLNDNGRYDFKAAGKSELDPSLPQEATIPATCGVINPVR